MYVNNPQMRLTVRRPVAVGGMEDLGTAAAILIFGLAAISFAGIVLIVKAVK